MRSLKRFRIRIRSLPACMAYSMRPLFGGALSTELPSDWIDASDVRPVPDHQEVWMSPAAGALASLVVELLERDGGADDDGEAADAALREYFTGLAAECGAALATVATVDAVPDVPARAALPAATACVLTGTHGTVARNGGLTTAHLAMGLLRLPPPLATDVLLTACCDAGTGAAEAVVRRALATFAIHDASLFCGTPVP